MLQVSSWRDDEQVHFTHLRLLHHLDSKEFHSAVCIILIGNA
jgi:hypothetical protein